MHKKKIDSRGWILCTSTCGTVHGTLNLFGEFHVISVFMLKKSTLGGHKIMWIMYSKEFGKNIEITIKKDSHARA